MFTGSRSAPDWGELPCRVVQPPTRCAPSCFLSTNENQCFRDRGQVGSRFLRHCLARDFHPKHAYTDWENRQAGLLASPHQSRWDRKVPGHSQEIFLQQQREREAQAGIMPALATCSDLGNTGLGPRETDRTGSRQVTGFCLPASLNSDAVTLH